MVVLNAFGERKSVRHEKFAEQDAAPPESGISSQSGAVPLTMSKGFTTQNTNGPGAAPPVRQPLIPASALPERAFHVESIPDNRYLPLAEHGTQRARGSLGSEENHRCGVFGEFAAARFFGLSADDVDTQVYEYGDPGYDFEVRGYRIDVKTTKQYYSRPSLMVDAEKELVADFYMLVHQLAERCYRIIGYASRQAVANARTRYVGEYSPREVRVIDQDGLIPLPASLSGIFS